MLTVMENVIFNQIVCSDVIELAQHIDTESMDCILVDPPYNIGKDFGNKSDCQEMKQYVDWCSKWLFEFERILKPSGTGFIYGFDEILAYISINLSLPHRWLTWYYTNKNAANPSFWQRSHESIIVFWKDSKKRIFNADKVREPYTETFLKNAAGKKRKATIGRFSKTSKVTVYKAHKLGAMPRDVIKVPALAGGAGVKERIYYCDTCKDVFFGNKKKHKNHKLKEHPTQKPQELTKKLLNSCLPLNSPTNKLVYIPFAGSGSECLTCFQMGFDFVASDLNEHYVERCNRLLEKCGRNTIKGMAHYLDNNGHTLANIK